MKQIKHQRKELELTIQPDARNRNAANCPLLLIDQLHSRTFSFLTFHWLLQLDQNQVKREDLSSKTKGRRKHCLLYIIIVLGCFASGVLFINRMN